MKIITKELALLYQCRLSKAQKQISAFFVLSFVLCTTLNARGQEIPFSTSTSRTESTAEISSTLPETPQPAAQSSAQLPLAAFRMSPQQKFRYASENAFGVSSAVFTAAGAGVNQAQNLYPEFHQGAEGYGRYFWHSYADQAVKYGPNQSITYLRRAIANGRVALFKGVFSVGGVVNSVKSDCEKAISLNNGGNYTQALAHYVFARTHAKISEKWAPARSVLGLGWADND